MKKWGVIIILLLLFIGTELYTLSYIDKAKLLISSDGNRLKIKDTKPQIRLIDPSLSNPFVEKAKVAFQRVKKNENLKLTLLFEQKGYAQVLIDDEKNIPYITLVDGEGKKLFTFGANYYDHMYKVRNGEKIHISIEDVKTGDMIVDKEYFDVSNSTNSAEVLIYEK